MSKNHDILAVIFDFGNVICSFDNNLFLQRLAEHTGKSLAELDELGPDHEDV